jgi:glycosyltransferase involved in cell wall biosynthesis
MKKILFLTPNFPFPPKDGFRNRVFNLIKNLSRYYDITVLSFIIKGEEKYLNDLKLYAEVFTVGKDEGIVAKTKNLGLSFVSKKPYLALSDYSKVFENKLKIILKDGFNYVFFEGLQMSQYVDPVRESVKILDLHNPEHVILKNLHDKEKNAAKKSFMKTQLDKAKEYELAQVKKFDKVFTVSKKDAYHVGMANFYNNFLVPNGCNIHDIEFIFKQNLLYVGSLDYKPNEEGVLWFLNEILPQIKERFPSIVFYVIGRNPSDSIKKFESENVKILGYVEDIMPYYNRASIFVAPLLTPGGQRAKIINAMSFKKCVVATSIAADSLGVEDNHTAVLADEPQQFVNKILGLLNNPQVTRDIAEKGFELAAKEYDWKEIAKEIETILESK